jgi:hypothetical protein
MAEWLMRWPCLRIIESRLLKEQLVVYHSKAYTKGFKKQET